MVVDGRLDVLLSIYIFYILLIQWFTDALLLRYSSLREVSSERSIRHNHQAQLFGVMGFGVLNRIPIEYSLHTYRKFNQKIFSEKVKLLVLYTVYESNISHIVCTLNNNNSEKVNFEFSLIKRLLTGFMCTLTAIPKIVTLLRCTQER